MYLCGCHIMGLADDIKIKTVFGGFKPDDRSQCYVEVKGWHWLLGNDDKENYLVTRREKD